MNHARRRVLAISSGGGHWMQLRRLRPAFEDFDTHWASVDSAYREELGGEPFHFVDDATRWDRLALLRCAFRVIGVLVRVRPDVIVTTGAAPGFFAILFGRLVRARTVWVDSIANAEELSGSGRWIGRFADLWLTQWPHLAVEGGPHHAGAVL